MVTWSTRDGMSLRNLREAACASWPMCLTPGCFPTAAAWFTTVVREQCRQPCVRKYRKQLSQSSSISSTMLEQCRDFAPVLASRSLCRRFPPASWPKLSRQPNCSSPRRHALGKDCAAVVAAR
ncbi:unnamed protein product, partial [Symbiodinium sp. KB8]